MYVIIRLFKTAANIDFFKTFLPLEGGFSAMKCRLALTNRSRVATLLRRRNGGSLCLLLWFFWRSNMSIETLQPAETNNKPAQETREPKKEDDKSGDEYERKDQDPPLEIGEHYLVKRGEDSWRKHFRCCIINIES
jgi:hypothetical protein